MEYVRGAVMEKRIVLKENTVVAVINHCDSCPNYYQLIIFPEQYPSHWLCERIFSTEEKAQEFLQQNKQAFVKDWDRISKEAFNLIYFQCQSIRESYRTYQIF